MATRTLTETLVRQHGMGRSDSFGAALLDIAQDHLLWLLAELGCFDGGSLILKGGTALRKCRFGQAGRFSTDLDFTAPSDETVLGVCESIDGASIGGFQFSIQDTRGNGRHWSLQVRHAQFGQPDVAASIEFASRPLILQPDRLEFVELPIHRVYSIQLPELPVIAKAEACAEKLARYRRVALSRDVYDLAQLAIGPMNEPLVRRLWVLKVWSDVVDDGRGTKPADPTDVLTFRSASDFAQESIGRLTRPIDLESWERQARERFAFLSELDETERRWLECDPRHRHEIESAAIAGGFT